jgi:hypothetical protein
MTFRQNLGKRGEAEKEKEGGKKGKRKQNIQKAQTF